MKKIILPALAVLSLGFTPALANDHTEALTLLNSAKITLADAVTKAEGLYPYARALDAELDFEQGKAVWEVTVVTADKIYDVVLDADSGAVISNVEDKD